MKKVFWISLFIAMICPVMQIAFAQSRDNDDGTFSNPVIWGDFPDPDVILVGDTYYMVSTSMHYFPGVTILDSKDLVNWNITCNVVKSFKEHPAYDLNGGHRYAKGQWATSLRYFNGKFHVLFTTLTEGSFIYSTTDPKGTWTKTKVNGVFLYDPGMFVDNDGRLYVVHGNTNIHIIELNPETLQPLGVPRKIYQSHEHGLEGNRCYHIGDYYYIYCTYGSSHLKQTCLRSRNLFGPYEERTVLSETAKLADHYIHQSSLIELPDGRFYGMIFHDRGGLGRVPFLLPVYWVDNWPILGNPMDGIITLDKPLASDTVLDFPTTDEFDNSELALQWQFNHNPDENAYSLTERKGHLRLHTATLTDSLKKARNTVCQRIFGPRSEGTAKFDISKMKYGDRAGLVIVQKPFATLTIEKTKQGNMLSMTENEEVKETVKLKGKTVYLRARVNGISDKVNFYYSTNGINFFPLGTEFKMSFSLKVFTGNRYGLFNYSTVQKGGYVDVDWFRVKHEPMFERTCKQGKVLEAEWFDHQYLCKTEFSSVRRELRNQNVVFDEDGGMIAFNKLEMVDKGLNCIGLDLKCMDMEGTVEVHDYDTGEILGSMPLPRQTKEFETLKLPLNRPLTNTSRLEIRVWKKRDCRGHMALDRITFLEIVQEYKGYELIWNDEFNGEGLPDPAKWNATHIGGVINKELQDYRTNDVRCTRIEEGKLILDAFYDPHDGKAGWNSNKDYHFEYSAGEVHTSKKSKDAIRTYRCLCKNFLRQRCMACNLADASEAWQICGNRYNGACAKHRTVSTGNRPHAGNG